MKAPDEVAAMVRLKALGWGSEADRSRTRVLAGTVRRWWPKAWAAYRPPRRSKKLTDWGLAGRAVPASPRQCRCRPPGSGARARHHGQPAHGGTGGRAAAPGTGRRGARDGAFRDAAGSTSCRSILARRAGRSPVRACSVYLFVATLGYSRRLYVRAFRHERQESWFDGIESAFRHFRRGAAGGAARQRPGAGRSSRSGQPGGQLHPRLHAFAGIGGFGPGPAHPTAHAPRVRTSVASATSSRTRRRACFTQWAAMEAHLDGGSARSPTGGFMARRRARRRAFPARRGERATAINGPRTVPANPRAAAPGQSRLCGRTRRQRLLRAVAADRRNGSRHCQRRAGCASVIAAAKWPPMPRSKGRRGRAVIDLPIWPGSGTAGQPIAPPPAAAAETSDLLRPWPNTRPPPAGLLMSWLTGISMAMLSRLRLTRSATNSTRCSTRPDGGS